MAIQQYIIKDVTDKLTCALCNYVKVHNKDGHLIEYKDIVEETASQKYSWGNGADDSTTFATTILDNIINDQPDIETALANGRANYLTKYRNIKFDGPTILHNISTLEPFIPKTESHVKDYIAYEDFNYIYLAHPRICLNVGHWALYINQPYVSPYVCDHTKHELHHMLNILPEGEVKSFYRAYDEANIVYHVILDILLRCNTLAQAVNTIPTPIRAFFGSFLDKYDADSKKIPKGVYTLLPKTRDLMVKVLSPCMMLRNANIKLSEDIRDEMESLCKLPTVKEIADSKFRGMAYLESLDNNHMFPILTINKKDANTFYKEAVISDFEMMTLNDYLKPVDNLFG